MPPELDDLVQTLAHLLLLLGFVRDFLDTLLEVV